MYQIHFQGRGVGTLLLNSVVESVNSDITLKCLKNNKLGIKFYLKKGWESVSEGESDEGGYILFKYRNPGQKEYQSSNPPTS